jgi:2-polyprenyl-3-methyl-5-hydroxy-6-metoxy-1,4-benzoquinol methylase
MATALPTEIDPRYGSRRLSETASTGDVHEYFRTAYYDAINSGEKGVDIKRSLDGGSEAENQRTWLANTLYADLAWAITQFSNGKRVLDAGCGTGDLLDDLQQRGFEVEGAEIAPEAAASTRAKGHTVHEGAFETLSSATRYDAVLFISVLSHASDPQAMLEHARRLLAPGGVVIIRSGNDFNPLQSVLANDKAHGEYWVTADHQHYFSFDSVGRLLDAAGFDLAYQQSDFPIEMLALMGRDFVGDADLGKAAHEQRVCFEGNIPNDTRRTLYQALANAGLGRCLFMVGRTR